jgi:DNA-directed RNA polymerase subunit H (RpoH/RPB5)
MSEWTLYQNICKMVTYRDAVGTENHDLTQQRLTSQMNAQEYIVIRAQRAGHAFRPGVTMCIVFVRAQSDIPTTKPKFKKLISSLKLAGVAHSELLFISGDTSTHVQKYIKSELKTELPNVYFESASHDIFSIELPKHVTVPTHIILSPTEKERYVAKVVFQPAENMPRILPSDPMAIWMGIRPGDLVKIITPSETAGEAERLRYCY